MEISLCDISGIMTKAPCEAALVGERHVRIEISDFVMRVFVLSNIKLFLERFLLDIFRNFRDLRAGFDASLDADNQFRCRHAVAL